MTEDILIEKKNNILGKKNELFYKTQLFKSRNETVDLFIRRFVKKEYRKEWTDISRRR